jgi:hypothetical protein
MKIMPDEEYEKEQRRIQTLERLVRRMAYFMKDYQLPDIDYEAKEVLAEAEQFAIQ